MNKTSIIRLAILIVAAVMWTSALTLAGYGIYAFFFADVEPPPAQIIETPAPPVENTEERPTTITRNAIATWYGSGPGECDGCSPHYNEDGSVYYVMANDEILDDAKFTVAYDCAALRDRLQVNLGGKSVVVEVTDRIGAGDCSHVDLSRAAFEALAPLSTGLLNVEIVL